MTEDTKPNSYDDHRLAAYEETLDRMAANGRSKEARRAAFVAGADTFIAATPCKHGHDPVRATDSGRCLECDSPGNVARQKNEARLAGPMTWMEATERKMRYYFPTVADAMLYCKDFENGNPVHNGLFRVGLMRGFCLACYRKTSRVRAKARKRLPKFLE